ncbi:hypothetical protein LZ30DRAFT_783718 [Colletotrichum cereale]|nr:hypothetical protein LZ30DRAFT_783718 [Colletotrichum cereale]
MAEEPRYCMRDAGSSPNDTEFVAAAFDSTLPCLASIGCGEMWGKVPLSEKDGFLEETRVSIEQPESYRQTGVGGEIQVFVAEVGVGTTCPDELKETNVQTRVCEDGEIRPSVAAASADDREDAGEHAYVEFMVADHRTGKYHKGAGAALLQHMQQYYRNKGFNAMYVDARADNGRKLVE